MSTYIRRFLFIFFFFKLFVGDAFFILFCFIFSWMVYSHSKYQIGLYLFYAIWFFFFFFHFEKKTIIYLNWNNCLVFIYLFKISLLLIMSENDLES